MQSTTHPARAAQLRRTFSAVVAAAFALSLVACSSPGTDTANDSAKSGDSAQQSGYPVTVDNCGEDLVIKAQPKNVLMLSTVPVGSIEAAGGLDQITQYSGSFTGDYFSDAVRKHFADIKPITDKVIQPDLAREAIVQLAPDLVIGYESQAITRKGLAEVGIQMYTPPAWCPNAPQVVTFDDAYKQVEVYGKMFGHEDVAAAAVKDMRKRVAAVKPIGGSLKTAAFVYPRAGGTMNGYGRGSIATAQLETLGLTNVFGDQKSRSVEVNLESLIAKNPDVIVVAYSEDSTPEKALGLLRSIPGSDALTAVKEGHVITAQVALLDPAGAFSVVALERLSEQLKKMSS